MRILNINSYYYSSTVHKQLQTYLIEKKVDLITYVPVSKGYIGRDECNYGKEEYVKKVECYNKIDRYFFFIKHKKIVRNIVNLINVDKFDCIHAHSLFSNGYIAMKMKEKFGKPYVVSVRDTDVNTFFKYMKNLNALGNQILKEADAIIFLSPRYRDYVINRYVKIEYRESILSKSYVIPNGINNFWLENKHLSNYILDNKSIKLLYVGAISKRKNILTIIKAVEILKKEGYSVNLTVVGKIIDKKVYSQLIKYKFVKYESPKSKEVLLGIYREHQIFVMPSITETFGIVYPEAMSQSLPVIYSKGQGFDGQCLEGKVGFGVQCFDYKEIAQRIKDIINNYNIISKQCFEECNKFNWKDISDEYIRIFKLILE